MKLKLFRGQLPLALVGLGVFWGLAVSAAGLSTSQSSSQNSRTQSYQLGIDFGQSGKLNLGYSSTRDLTGDLEDPSASATKISYRQRLNPGFSFTAEVKRTDDFFYFTGQGVGLRLNARLFRWQTSAGEEADLAVEESTPPPPLDFRASLKLDSQTKTYSKSDDKSFSIRTVRVGASQDLPWGFTLGVDVARSTYGGSDPTSERILQGQVSSTLPDLNDFASGFVASSRSLFLEWGSDRLTIGASVGRDETVGVPSSGDTTGLSPSSTQTSEVYLDGLVNEWLGLNLSHSTGRAEFSTTPTTTTSFGFDLNY